VLGVDTGQVDTSKRGGEANMHVAERTVEGHRIYAAAIAVEQGAGREELDGFYAAVVVVRLSEGDSAREEVFRDEQLDDGKVWTDLEQALQFALEVGEAAIRAQAWLTWRLAGQQGFAAQAAQQVSSSGGAGWDSDRMRASR